MHRYGICKMYANQFLLNSYLTMCYEVKVLHGIWLGPNIKNLNNLESHYVAL